MRYSDCRLSYKGLGEPLCFLAFGPLATSAFFVAQVSLDILRKCPHDSCVCGKQTLLNVLEPGMPLRTECA